MAQLSCLAAVNVNEELLAKAMCEASKVARTSADPDLTVDPYRVLIHDHSVSAQP